MVAAGASGVADHAKPNRGAKAMRGKRGSNELHERGSTMNEGKNPKEGGQEARSRRGEVASLP